jgi:hypothetical protein
MTLIGICKNSDGSIFSEGSFSFTNQSAKDQSEIVTTNASGEFSFTPIASGQWTPQGDKIVQVTTVEID